MGPTKTISRKSSGSSKISSHKMSQTPITARKASRKTERAEKPIFKGLILSIAGSVTTSAGDIIPYENIANWFTIHGGSYEREVNEKTTHLICSIEEYQKRGPQVQKAWMFSRKANQCQVVQFDWLEDSLLSKNKRRRVEKGYTLDRVINRIAKGKRDHAAFRESFEKGVRVSKELCDNRLHKVYFDADGFEYKILLIRIDLSSDRVKVEKYTLYLFESLAIPHAYMCGAKLSRAHRPTSYYREKCHPKDFREAFRDFKHFFFEKTHSVWDDRLEGIKVPGYFVYTPPVLGRPVGLLPHGYTRPELRHTEVRSDKEEVVYDTDSDVDDSEPDFPTKSPSRVEDEAANDAGSIVSQESVFEGYGYQPNIPDRRHSASTSPNLTVQSGYWSAL